MGRAELTQDSVVSAQGGGDTPYKTKSEELGHTPTTLNKPESKGSVVPTASDYMDKLLESDTDELLKPGDIINPELLGQELVRIYKGLETKGIFQEAEIVWFFVMEM